MEKFGIDMDYRYQAEMTLRQVQGLCESTP